MSLTRSRIFGALLLTVLTVFVLSALWEFSLEAILCDALGLPYDHEFETAERWRFVVTSTAFAAVSLLLPALLLFNVTDRLTRSYKSLANAKRLAQSLSRVDALTGLPNRAVFNEELYVALAKSRGRNSRCALLSIDLNEFKLANGLYGHATGDAVLRIVAERLADSAPPGALVARTGGDEFALLVPGIQDETAQLELAERVAARIGEGVSIGSVNFDISATIGIAISDPHTDTESLLAAADMALHHAKQSSSGHIGLFDESMGREMQTRVELERRMRAILSEGGFLPYYQPLVYLDDRRLFGYELLARWPNSEDKIAPDVFIPIAEELGMIDELTFQLLRKACQDLKNWPPHFKVAMNLSPAQLASEDLPQRILAILTESGVPPGRLELEITESAVMTHLDLARETLASLRNTGISIALDDFGTGHSSLSQLRTLPFDKIKVDRSFIRSMRMNADSRKLVAAILGIGQNMGFKITAEGVEQEADAVWLAAHGCNIGQGALFGMPLSQDEVVAMLREEQSARRPMAMAS